MQKIKELLEKQLELLCEESTKNLSVHEIAELTDGIAKIASVLIRI